MRDSFECSKLHLLIIFNVFWIIRDKTLIALSMNQIIFYTRKKLKSATLFCTDFSYKITILLFFIDRYLLLRGYKTLYLWWNIHLYILFYFFLNFLFLILIVIFFQTELIIHVWWFYVLFYVLCFFMYVLIDKRKKKRECKDRFITLYQASQKTWLSRITT